MSMTDTVANSDENIVSRKFSREIRAAWKDLAAKKSNTRADHTMVILLRQLAREHPDFQDDVIDPAELEHAATIADDYLLFTFTPVTNKRKLANGRRNWDTLTRELSLIASPYRMLERKTEARRLGVELTLAGDTNLRAIAEFILNEFVKV